MQEPDGQHALHGGWGLSRDAWFIVRHLPDLGWGALTLMRTLYTSTRENRPLDELNLHNTDSAMNLLKQGLYTSLTLPLGVWRAGQLVVEDKSSRADEHLPQLMVGYTGDPSLAKNFPNERWFFINGICTDAHGLRLNCRRLEETFGRPVQGIYNETNGFGVDFLECFIQRNLDLYTSSVRSAADIIKRQLLSDDHCEVILIGHSQGGIILSLVLDILADDKDISNEALGRVRGVFTFGSAADEFQDPFQRRQAPMHERRPIHIEHYANELDLVANLGVLNFFSNSSYAGRLFVMRKEGHLFNTHYELQDAYAERDRDGQPGHHQSFLFRLGSTRDNVRNSIKQAEKQTE